MTTRVIHPTGVKLEPAVKMKLKRLSQLKHRTMHWLMKEAITRYVEHEEKVERLKQETLARWEQEAMRNKVVDNESVMAWLDTWGTEHETGRPSCEKIIWLDSAVDDVVRLQEFVAANNPKAAKKAAQTVKKAVQKLKEFPNIGRPVSDLPDYRDLFIRFGAAGYVMRYRIYQGDVYVLHVRHYRESRFRNE